MIDLARLGRVGKELAHHCGAGCNYSFNSR